MKACILAGGSGVRLRPLTCTRPKPMMTLFDHPVLEYTLTALKSCGVEECLLTLLYLPDVIRDHFGDEYGGIRLRYTVEEEPVGSAGGMRAFRKALADDDFFVISGDAVFDLDLRRAWLFHKEKKAKATLILSRAKDPTGFGAVLTDEEGAIAGFREKPAWEGVSTGRVNTGLYVLSPAVFDKIPEGREFDFSGDLFPLLLAERSLYGIELPGYWRDMGSPEGYLEVVRDGLGGVWAPSIPLSGRDAPKNVFYRPPCYLSPGALVGEGAVIGPFASIETGAEIGRGSSVSYSAVLGKTGEDSMITGAILDRRSRVGKASTVMPLSVLGEGAVVGKGCRIGRGVHVLCDAVVEDGTRAESERELGGLTFAHHFVRSAGRALLTALSDVRLLASGIVRKFGKRIALSGDGESPCAVSFTDAFQAEAAALGAEVFRLDAPTPAVAAYMTKTLAASAGVWFSPQTGGGAEAILYGPDGVKLSGKDSAFPLRRMDPGTGGLSGRVRRVTGTAALYAAEGRKQAIWGEFHVLCKDSVLSEFLRNAGVKITEKAEGFPTFEPTADGHGLKLVSEKGYAFTPDEASLLTLAALFSLDKNRLAVTAEAPSAAESVAADRGKTLLRVGRDPEAGKLYAEEPALHQGAFAALALIKALLIEDKTLAAFSASIPSSVSVLRDYRTSSDRVGLMDRFADSMDGVRSDRTDGIRLFLDGAYLSLRLSPYDRLLTLKAESHSEETAAELCDFYFEKLKALEKEE